MQVLFPLYFGAAFWKACGVVCILYFYAMFISWKDGF